MSSTDKQGDVSVQRKDDCVSEKEKGQNDGKSDSSPQKRSAAELSSTDEVKQKMQKTDHKNKEENGESEDKYDEEGDEDDDVIPDDYDEGEDGEGEDGDEGADEEDEDDDEA